MIAILDGWIAVARSLARMAIWAGGALILGSALLIGVEVLSRKLFLVSIGGADELSGYAFAIGTSWAFAFALLERFNVRVDALYSHFSERTRAYCDVLTLVALLVFVGFLGWRALQVFATSVQFGSRATTPLATPLWIPQGLWVLGLGLFLFSMIPLFLRTLAALFTGDLRVVKRLAGARTMEEEVADETSHVVQGSPSVALGSR